MLWIGGEQPLAEHVQFARNRAHQRCGRALLDGQTLSSGAEEGPFEPPADSYRLDLSTGGALTLTLDGEPRSVRSSQPASYRISDDGVRSTSFKGPECP